MSTPAPVFPASNYDIRLVDDYITGGKTTEDDRRAAWFAATGCGDLEDRMVAVDDARQQDVLRTIERARQLGLGWQGNATDVAHLFRALRRGKLIA